MVGLPLLHRNIARPHAISLSVSQLQIRDSGLHLRIAVARLSRFD